MNLPRYVMLALLMLLLAACGQRQPVALVTSAPTQASATPAPSATAAPSATPTAQPTQTATFSATPEPTATSTATPTLTPSATPTSPHPLDIAYMRSLSYPGSELIFEETLAPGGNYDRYIVSYLSEGLKIYAYMTVPQGQPPETGWPVVIFNHGYIPPDIYRSTERYVAYVDAFARQGYIVFRSDYRGHGFSEGEPSGSSRSADYTIDVLNGMASVKRYAQADVSRIGMWGHSMGGGITLRAMVLVPDIKAGVIWAGMVAPYPDILRWYTRRLTPAPTGASTTPGATRLWAQSWLDEYGDELENPAFWSAISPNSYLADLSGPVAVHHGTADTSVPLEYSLDLAKQIEQAGRPVELYTYEGDDHNIAGNWGTAMTRSVAFMNEHVKGEASR